MTTDNPLMSPPPGALDQTAPQGMPTSPFATGVLAAWGRRAEELLESWSDWLNPIVVKEARQAMKSRQFSITFMLLVILGLIWTVCVIAFNVPAVYYESFGPGLLTGYYWLLSIPLLLIVPFSAFRSLAGETEDGTFELLSITKLSALQIVLGKLASAALQMLVYNSALAPCIAFSYMLRGIDVISIILLLTYTNMLALLLSIIGLLLATVTRSRHWQMVISVLLVIGLLYVGLMWNMVMTVGARESLGQMPYDMWQFWTANLAILSFYLAFAALFLLIAAGQISFASDNKSTRVRIALVIIQTLWIGWSVFVYSLRDGDFGDTYEVVLYASVFVGAMVWAVAGAALSSERLELSPRAKRELPQTWLGRLAFTWFNPGSGTGYIFSIVSFTALLALQCLMGFYPGAFGQDGSPRDLTWFFLGLCLWGYLAGYLGLTRLLVALARRRASVNVFTAFLLQVIVALAGVLIPLIIDSFYNFSQSTYLWTYSPLEFSNWAWTITEVLDRGKGTGLQVCLPVFLVGMGIFLLNLLEAAAEVEHTRTAIPIRILEEEAALHPAPAAPRKKTPWDD